MNPRLFLIEEALLFGRALLFRRALLFGRARIFGRARLLPSRNSTLAAQVEPRPTDEDVRPAVAGQSNRVAPLGLEGD